MLIACCTAAILATADPRLPDKQPARPPVQEPSKPDAAQTPDPAKPLLPFPCPLVTEVYYNVSPGDGGDANKDGARQVAGDEFVELINPHDKPISIGGYTLSDMTAHEKTNAGKPKSGAIRWTFPPLTLKPGQIVVVFNGNASTIAGPVGDSSAAPPKGNDAFNGALVFTMRQPSDKTGFANTADWVMLSAPDGKPVHIVKWGEQRVKPPADTLLVEDAPAARTGGGSVQRTAANAPFAAHPAPSTDGGGSFSPGVFAMPTPPSPSSEPEPKKPDAPANPTPTKPSAKPELPPASKPAEPAKKPKF